MIKTGKGGKTLYTFTEDQLRTYQTISDILNSRSLPDAHESKKKRSTTPKEVGFLKPIIANESVEQLIDLVSQLDPNLTLNNTHVSHTGEITTCYSDIKACLSKYIKEANCKSGDYIVLDDNLINILGENYVDGEIRKGTVEIVGHDLYMHKNHGGKPSKLASFLYKK